MEQIKLPEGLLTKIVPLFLKRSVEEGGLAMSDVDFGLIYGTLGVIGLLLGGIVGGVFISKRGLKKSLWWMAACMTLPCLTFVYLSTELPENLWAIGTAISIEQFGYGFGFTAYMMYMMYFSEGEFKTSHYAICTAFMALSMMLPGFGYYRNGHWLQGLLLDGCGLQRRHVAGYVPCLPQTRPGIRKEVRTPQSFGQPPCLWGQV